MSKPRLLDLFCGAGGATRGYQQAGFYVIGVDIEPQPHYVGDEFVQADATMFPLDGFHAVHASPPCQKYSKRMRHLVTRDYPMLIGPILARLTESGLPWAVENVVGAPLPHQDTLDGRYGVELCGTMFGLRFWRHRLFEASFPVAPPRHCDHSVRPINPKYRKSELELKALLGATGPDAVERAWRDEMGVSWMNRPEGREAIPPAFTEYIGAALLEHLSAKRGRAA